jgi:putative flippase GtrA
LNHFINYQLSVAIAYLVGMFTAFLAFKFFVFDTAKSGKTKKEVMNFVIVNIIVMIQILIISSVMVEVIFPYLKFYFYPHGVAHVIALGTGPITSYVLNRKFTFIPTKDKNDERIIR